VYYRLFGFPYLRADIESESESECARILTDIVIHEVIKHISGIS